LEDSVSYLPKGKGDAFVSDLGPLFDGQGVEFGHLQREAQRRQNAADAARQKAQNDQIIGLLKQQKAEQEREKRRLDALPKCPACLSPVEVGSRRCAKCQSAIVSWDNRSFRLICLAEEAGKHLQARIDELSQQVVEWAGEALRSTTQYADLIKSQIVPPCKAIAASLNKTGSDGRLDATTVFASYLAEKPLLSPKQLDVYNASLLRHKDLACSHDENLEGVWEDTPDVAVGGLFIMRLSITLAVIGLLMLSAAALSDMGLLLTLALMAVMLLSSAGLYLIGYRRHAAGKKLAAAEIDRIAELQASEQVAAIASEQWRSRLEKAGITPHLDGLKRAILSADNSASHLNKFSTSANDAMAEIAETLQFANAIGTSVEHTGPRVRGELAKISPRALQPQELIEACNRGQFTALQTAYDDAVRLAQSLQLLCKP